MTKICVSKDVVRQPALVSKIMQIKDWHQYIEARKGVLQVMLDKDEAEPPFVVTLTVEEFAALGPSWTDADLQTFLMTRFGLVEAAPTA